MLFVLILFVSYVDLENLQFEFASAPLARFLCTVKEVCLGKVYCLPQCYSSTFPVSCSIFSFSAAMVVLLSQAFCRDQLLYLRRMLVHITFSSSSRSCFCSSANACNSHKSFSLKNVMCHLKTMQILFLDLTS